MAECHPVGFQWVMEAKKRGAKVIHIDPRFTRTSAVADMHVPLRAGSDIAFLGGIVNYILENEKYFRDYVLAYTNAATILRDDFVDTDDLDGVFSGYDPESGTYDTATWQYEGVDETAPSGEETKGEHDQSRQSRGAGYEMGGHGASLHASDVRRDDTLTDPRCVFQVLKRHYRRYTPPAGSTKASTSRARPAAGVTCPSAATASTTGRGSRAAPATRWAATVRHCTRPTSAATTR